MKEKKRKKFLGHGRRAHSHATGTDFQSDKSTTRAVRERMRGMQYWLRGESIPMSAL